MKYRPGNNYEEIMVFTPTPKKGKYFAHAEFNGKVKVKCKFYNYETRTPITSEEVFDKYLIPFISGTLFNKDVRIACAGESAKSNTSNGGLKLKAIFNEDIGSCSHIHGGESHSDNVGVTKIKLDQLFK